MHANVEPHQRPVVRVLDRRSMHSPYTYVTVLSTIPFCRNRTTQVMEHLGRELARLGTR